MPEHALENVAPDTVVVNPARRLVDNTIRNQRGTLGRLHTQRARAGTASQKKRDLAGRVREAERDLQASEFARKRAPEPMWAGDLTAEQKLQALPAPLRQCHNTLRMIFYRAESQMAVAVAPSMDSPETARSLLKVLFHSDASPHPDAGAGTLTAGPPHVANRAHDRALAPLIDQLNRTRTVLPAPTCDSSRRCHSGRSQPPTMPSNSHPSTIPDGTVCRSLDTRRDDAKPV